MVWLEGESERVRSVWWTQRIRMDLVVGSELLGSVEPKQIQPWMPLCGAHSPFCLKLVSVWLLEFATQNEVLHFSREAMENCRMHC